jgi:hypothetical protein
LNEKRRYQRYTVNKKRDKVTQGKIKIGGKLVQLVNFSSSGLCVISNTSFFKKDYQNLCRFWRSGENKYDWQDCPAEEGKQHVACRHRPNGDL